MLNEVSSTTYIFSKDKKTTIPNYLFFFVGIEHMKLMLKFSSKDLQKEKLLETS